MAIVDGQKVNIVFSRLQSLFRRDVGNPQGNDGGLINDSNYCRPIKYPDEPQILSARPHQEIFRCFRVAAQHEQNGDIENCWLISSMWYISI
jgi:hypothetical protein